LSEQERFSVGGKLPLDAAIQKLPSFNVSVLAIATTSDVIKIFAQENGKFVPKLSLPGHEDWVRCLSMVSYPAQEPGGSGRIMLASGSQDGAIRLWSIDPLSESSPLAVLHSGGATHDQILDSIPNDDNSVGGDGSSQITSKQHVCKIYKGEAVNLYISVSLDALLVGHEAGVTSLSWSLDDSRNATPSILSTSTDSSLILWAPSSAMADDSLWIIQQRFGDLGGQRLGGFVGGFWASGGKAALAYGWNGCWRRWTLEEAQWTEAIAVTGHQDVVNGLSWSPDGDYLISTGQDQTTRVHAALSATAWHEVNRPQVHGYDLIDVVHVGSFSFASIADEKVVRVFEAPQPFVKVMKQLGAFQSEDESNRTSSVKLPPLGLSNKGSGGQDADAMDGVSVNSAELSVLESNLSANTLWPEVEKLFGHGYELNALAVSHSGRYVASACRATNAEHAVIRLFDTKKWQPFGSPLAGHTLTITRICWSSDDKYIISVSRDRTWRIHTFSEDSSHYLPTCYKKSHGRVIWDCAWLPNSHTFATGARDKTVQIWELSAGGRESRQLSTMNFDHAVTALDSTTVAEEEVVLSVGLENGDVLLYLAKRSDPSSWTLVEKTSLCAAMVERLAWRPTNSQNTQELAIASSDRSLRIIKVHFY